jgi:anti-sigma factor RsiW
MASDVDIRDISALADGTLDPARREQVTARIAGSPELSALYERERSVVALLHEARARDRAPAALRERIDRAAAAHARGRRRGRREPAPINRLLGGLVATAVVVVALVLLLPAGTPGAPSVSQAAALATLPSTTQPRVDSYDRANLLTNVQGLQFPNWGSQEGWKPVGERQDRLDGRAVVTVFYAKRGMRIAYTIVDMPALKTPSGGRLSDGYLSLALDGRNVVTWRNDNHTCVLSAAGSHVPAPGLLALAAQS